MGVEKTAGHKNQEEKRLQMENHLAHCFGVSELTVQSLTGNRILILILMTRAVHGNS